MPCYSPITAYRSADLSERRLVFKRERSASGIPIELPCGRCIGCRLDRSRQWAVRCMHESQMHEFNSFITLTFSDEHMPLDCSLDYYVFQCFMKRLRKRRAGVRFYMCGEYGERLQRPHYHAILFNVFFPDREVIRESEGLRLYESAELSALWPFGFASVGDVTFESAAYVARYCCKKVSGPLAESHYRVVDPDTGECFERVPEFGHMSLKPGIGFPWFERYRRDAFPRDYVVMRGVRMKVPRYYDELVQRDASFDWDQV